MKKWKTHSTKSAHTSPLIILKPYTTNYAKDIPKQKSTPQQIRETKTFQSLPNKRTYDMFKKRSSKSHMFHSTNNKSTPIVSPEPILLFV